MHPSPSTINGSLPSFVVVPAGNTNCRDGITNTFSSPLPRHDALVVVPERVLTPETVESDIISSDRDTYSSWYDSSIESEMDETDSFAIPSMREIAHKPALAIEMERDLRNEHQQLLLQRCKDTIVDVIDSDHTNRTAWNGMKEQMKEIHSMLSVLSFQKQQDKQVCKSNQRTSRCHNRQVRPHFVKSRSDRIHNRVQNQSARRRRSLIDIEDLKQASLETLPIMTRDYSQRSFLTIGSNQGAPKNQKHPSHHGRMSYQPGMALTHGAQNIHHGRPPIGPAIPSRRYTRTIIPPPPFCDSSLESSRRHTRTIIPPPPFCDSSLETNSQIESSDHRQRKIPSHDRMLMNEVSAFIEEYKPVGSKHHRSNFSARVLASKNPEQQKAMIRERLYRQIENIRPDKASEITDILLESKSAFELLNIVKGPRGVLSDNVDAVLAAMDQSQRIQAKNRAVKQRKVCRLDMGGNIIQV